MQQKTSNVDGVGGDIKESQVNQIEVAHGGVVTIGGGGGGGGGGGRSLGGGGGGSTEDGGVRTGGAGRFTRRFSPSGGGLAAPSPRLSRAGLPGNAIPPRKKFKTNKRNQDDDEWPSAVGDSSPLPSEDVEMQDVSRADPVGDELRRQAIQNEWQAKKKRLKKRGISLPAAGTEDTEMLETTKRKMEDGVEPAVATKRKREASEADDEGAKRAMKMLVQQRLDELHGGRKTYKLPRKTKKDIDRKIVHEMRDNYKDEVRRQAAKQGLRGDGEGIVDIEMEAAPDAPEKISRRVSKRDLDDDEWEDIVDERPVGRRRKVVAKRRSAASRRGDEFVRRARKDRVSPLVGKKRPLTEEVAALEEDGDEGDRVMLKARRRGRAPPRPRSTAVKRERDFGYGFGDERPARRMKTDHLFPFTGIKRERHLTDEDEPVDPFAYEPRSKTRNMTRAGVRAVGKWVGVKRKASDEAEIDRILTKKLSDEQEIDRMLQEQLTGVPFKSRPTSYMSDTSDEDV